MAGVGSVSSGVVVVVGNDAAGVGGQVCRGALMTASTAPGSSVEGSGIGRRRGRAHTAMVEVGRLAGEAGDGA